MKLKKILSCATLCMLPMTGGFAQEQASMDFKETMNKLIDKYAEQGKVSVRCFIDEESKNKSDINTFVANNSIQQVEFADLNDDEWSIFALIANDADAGYNLMDFLSQNMEDKEVAERPWWAKLVCWIPGLCGTKSTELVCEVINGDYPKEYCYVEVLDAAFIGENIFWKDNEFKFHRPYGLVEKTEDDGLDECFSHTTYVEVPAVVERP